MKISTQTRMASGLIFLFTSVLVGTVYQQVQTSLTEQDAASGDAFSNAAQFPESVAVALILFMVLILGQAFFNKSQASESSDTLPEGAARMQLGFLVLFGIYLATLELVGYQIMTPLFLTGLFGLLGNRSWLRCILYSLTISLTLSVFFELLLNVVLPLGFLNLSLPALLN